MQSDSAQTALPFMVGPCPEVQLLFISLFLLTAFLDTFLQGRKVFQKFFFTFSGSRKSNQKDCRPAAHKIRLVRAFYNSLTLKQIKRFSRSKWIL